METKANHFIVGLFVLGTAIALFFFVIWVVKLDIEKEPDRYRIYFTGSVSGLDPSANVYYQGVPVGKVTDIRIDHENPQLIRVAIEVAPGTPIKVDSLATLRLQGVTGQRYIEIAAGSRASPRLVAAPDEEWPVIRSAPSGLEEVIGGIPGLLKEVMMLAQRTEAFFSAENQASLAATLRNIETITGNVAARGEDIDRIIRNAAAATEELQAIAEEIGATMAAVRGTVASIDATTTNLGQEALGLIADFDGTAQSLTRTSEELQVLIAENRRPFQDFTNEGLHEMTLLLSDMRRLVDRLNLIASEFQTNPRGFLFGTGVKEFEPE